MEGKSRTYFVVKNGTLGIIYKLLILLLAFVSRSIFIEKLGAEYLGINGLYSNILSVLSLAELGIGNVLIFSLYKPIAEKDNFHISRLLGFYKKLYRYIAIGVFTIGVFFIPFLGYIVNSSLGIREVTIYYVIFLLNSVFSYLAIYKSTFLKANQKQYIVDTITTLTTLLVTVIQIVVLLNSGNFIIYLLIMIFGTIFQNVIITIITKKYYSSIGIEGTLSNSEKTTIINNVKSTFVYKISQVIINYTDNILISIMLGTVYVGYYSNYSLIVTQVMGIIGIINASLIASIGNLSTEGNAKKSLQVFNHLLLFYHILSAFCSICFITIFSDFITLWIGKENELNTHVVLAITFSFYIMNIINPVWMYREAYGLFKEIKYVMLITALVNIVLSIILGLKLGLAGIILATGLSRILTTVWYEPKVLYDKIFNDKPIKYLVTQLKYFSCSLLSLVIVFELTYSMKTGITGIIIKGLLSLVIVLMVFYVFNYRTESFKYWKRKVYTLIWKK